MNISLNPLDKYTKVNSTGYVSRGPRTKKADSEGDSTQKTSGNYDTFSISQDNTLSDEDFTEIQTKKIASAVREGVSAERVAEIKQRVQSGEYQPDNNRIAAHMLGYLG